MHRITLGILAAIAVPVLAQTPLTIREAIDHALQHNDALEAGRRSTGAASERIRAARGALLPQVSYTESWTRSNNQVFVFGSLLEQKQFTSANFDLGSLNNPAFLNNFQSQVIADQVLFDFGRRRAGIHSAELGRTYAAEQERKTSMQVIHDTIADYYGALAGQAAIDAATQSVRSAEADLDRSQKRRDAGMITDADVLAIRVHLAEMREAQIRATAGTQSARAALNQAMGEPLDTQYDLTTTLNELKMETAPDLEKQSAAERPESRQAALGIEMAEAQVKATRSALWPEFYLRAGFEADRQRFVDRGGANWLASAGLRWNLFNGFANRAQVAEAAEEAASRRAMAKYVASGIQVETRRAELQLEAARQRVAVASETVAMAEEALRITKNRYESGLSDVTELIRAETAVTGARMRHIEAVRDQRLAMLEVEMASGTLSKDAKAIQ